MSIQAGAHSLEIAQGGRGMLLGGVPGVPAAKVVRAGRRRGRHQCRAHGDGLGSACHHPRCFAAPAERARPPVRRDAEHGFLSTIDTVEEYVVGADLVIGGVLLPGAAAPKLITEKMIKQMKKGSVIVDVAIDQGGCAETSHATTHADPTYMVHGVVHYAVATCQAAWRAPPPSRSTTRRFPSPRALAEGPDEAMRKNPHLRAGLNRV